MNVFLKFLPNVWMKWKMNHYYKYEHKIKIGIFRHNKLKFNLEHRSQKSVCVRF